VGAGAPLPVEREHVCSCRCGGAPGGADVGTGARLPVERANVSSCRFEGTPGRADVGAGATPAVPVGRKHLHVCRAVSPSRGATVGNKTRRPCPLIACTVIRAPVARRAPCHGSP